MKSFFRIVAVGCFLCWLTHPASAELIQNGCMGNPALGGGAFQEGVPATGWTGDSGGLTNPPYGAGVITNGCPYGNPAAPDGNGQAGLIKGGQAAMLQDVVVPVGGQYKLAFYVATRGGNAPLPIGVTFGGSALVFGGATSVVPGNGYALYVSDPFPAAAGASSLKFKNDATANGDSSNFIDAVTMNEGLVLNGGFATNLAASAFREGSPAPGWTGAANSTQGTYGPGVVRDGSGYGNPVAPDGDGFAGLIKGGLASLSQPITGLTPGQSYQLTFQAATRIGFGGQPLDISVGSRLLEEIAPGGNYALYSYTFVAENSTEVLTFANNAGPASGDGDFASYVDAINVSAVVPEPSTLALLLMGAAAMVGLVWHRKSAA